MVSTIIKSIEIHRPLMMGLLHFQSFWVLYFRSVKLHKTNTISMSSHLSGILYTNSPYKICSVIIT
jgi:hypothetical protein